MLIQPVLHWGMILGSVPNLSELKPPWASLAPPCQEEPGGARRSQEEPGGARRSQEEPGRARRSHEEPGGARSSQAVLGGDWGSQGEPAGARMRPLRPQEEPGPFREKQTSLLFLKIYTDFKNEK